MSNKLESDMMVRLWNDLKSIHSQYEEGCRTFPETIFGMIAAMSESLDYAQREKLKDEIDEVAREMLGMPSHFEEWQQKVYASIGKYNLKKENIENLVNNSKQSEV